MIKYLYLKPDGKRDILDAPVKGEQYITWYKGRSRGNPGGYEWHDVVYGEDVFIRSTEFYILDKFLRTAFRRMPQLEVRKLEGGTE